MTEPESQNTSEATDPYAGHTPLMRQYFALRDAHPGTLLLFRLGDFYETFFEDAVKVSRLLGLTLTRRGKFEGKPIPMAGIPAATLEQYLARLVKCGESVAVSEQTEANEGEKNAMMQRKIVRIVTPGTLTDNALLSEKSDSVLLAVAMPKLKTTEISLVWLTLTNGRFRATKTHEKDLAETISRIAPSEVLVDEKGKDTLSSLGVGAKVTVLPAWHFDSEKGEAGLKERFSLASLAAWGLEHEAGILSAANALLDYVTQTQCAANPHIEPLTVEAESEFIGLDAATRRNLEIDEPLHETDGVTLFRILDTCNTGMGSRALRRWITEPMQDARIARSRHAAIRVLLAKQPEATSLSEVLREIPDIERIAGRIALKSVRPKELASLRDALPQVAQIAATLEKISSEAPIFAELLPKLKIDSSLEKLLTAMLLEEPATLLREGDVIRSEADAELAQERALRDNAGDFLTKLEAKEKERTGLSTLRVEYNRVSGYYIEVSRGQAANVPADYRRRQTLKNTERFITPELKAFEDKALSAKERARAIEKRLWDALVEEVNAFVESLLEAAKALSAIDALAALARHALVCDWVCPELDDGNGIEIRLGRHPVVEKTLEDFVPNDCSLGPGRRLLVITGPNMGGKSTYMRSVALIVLLAYAGSYVPAKSARIGKIDKILTRIGASDDLARGRSTFMVEMTEAASILHQATEHSLVLMDEIGRGTSTFDGLSLAAAIATDLAQRAKSLTLFATHYFELTQLVHTLNEAVNIHVRAEQIKGSVVFLHDIKEGPASRSYGIAVAKLAGIRPALIRRAENYLKKLEDRAIETQGQPDLFAGLPPATTEEAIVEKEVASEKVLSFLKEVSEIDVDKLTPRDALNLIYEMRDAAKKVLPEGTAPDKTSEEKPL